MDWTKITDEMPPTGKPVLLKQQREGCDPFVIVGKYIAKHTIESDDPEWIAEFVDYVEATDTYYYKEGFYERQMNWEAYAWIATETDMPAIEWMEIPGGEA